MKTSSKISIALVAVLATLIPLTTFFFPSKQKFDVARMDKHGSAQPVLGPIYNPQTLPEQSQPTPAPAVPDPNQPEASTKRPVVKSGNASRSTGGTANSQIISKSPVIGAYSQTDLYWLAKMVYAEAAAEPFNGQVAVAAVILHRVASPGYPKTIKEVLFQVVDGHYQFTPVQNGYINQVEPNATAYKAARDALAGVDPSKGALLYYNPKTSTNKWILSKPITTVIGNHTFAR